MKTFQVTTIFNDPVQYAAMRASFAAAGFDESCCDYRAFDNSGGNRDEPYAAFGRAARESNARYLIYCHQDIRLDRGHGCDRLRQVLQELDERHPAWAVAGNAGMDAAHQVVARVHHGGPPLWTSGPLPWPVVSLDENFFVVNGRDNARWSEELAGFHFYGSDVCFHAMARGKGAYIIDFHLTHLGAGRVAPHFDEQHRALVRCWTRHSSFCIGYAITGVQFVLTRNRALRWVFDRPGLQRRLQRPRWRKLLAGLVPPISTKTLRCQP